VSLAVTADNKIDSGRISKTVNVLVIELDTEPGMGNKVSAAYAQNVAMTVGFDRRINSIIREFLCSAVGFKQLEGGQPGSSTEAVKSAMKKGIIREALFNAR